MLTILSLAKRLLETLGKALSLLGSFGWSLFAAFAALTVLTVYSLVQDAAVFNGCGITINPPNDACVSHSVPIIFLWAFGLIAALLAACMRALRGRSFFVLIALASLLQACGFPYEDYGGVKGYVEEAVVKPSKTHQCCPSKDGPCLDRELVLEYATEELARAENAGNAKFALGILIGLMLGEGFLFAWIWLREKLRE